MQESEMLTELVRQLNKYGNREKLHPITEQTLQEAERLLDGESSEEVFATKMGDKFVVVDAAPDCQIKFVTDVSEKHKVVQVQNVSKDELCEMIHSYKDGSLMQVAFKSLPDDQRELIVHGPKMLDMYDIMEGRSND